MIAIISVYISDYKLDVRLVSFLGFLQVSFD